MNDEYIVAIFISVHNNESDARQSINRYTNGEAVIVKRENIEGNHVITKTIDPKIQEW